jgi:hypothetical protein
MGMLLNNVALGLIIGAGLGYPLALVFGQRGTGEG